MSLPIAETPRRSQVTSCHRPAALHSMVAGNLRPALLEKQAVAVEVSQARAPVDFGPNPNYGECRRRSARNARGGHGGVTGKWLNRNQRRPKTLNSIQAADTHIDPPEVLEWHSGLSVGNALLDRQHILLVELARTLTDSALSGDAARSAAADILDYAQRHCAAEEHLLIRQGYEWTEQHREEHVVGLDRLRALCTEVQLGVISRVQLAAAIGRWVMNHLIDMDLPAREYLRHLPFDDRSVEGTDPLRRA